MNEKKKRKKQENTDGNRNKQTEKKKIGMKARGKSREIRKTNRIKC